MKVLALNLPQFHEVPENNEWWGQGFTEWTNVKKAKPVYEGHVQPMEPIDGYYYDLRILNTAFAGQIIRGRARGTEKSRTCC